MFGSRVLPAGPLLLPAPVGAHAAGITTQSSTLCLRHNDPFQDKTRGNFPQHVKPGATKVDAAGRFSTVGSGRGNFR